MSPSFIVKRLKGAACTRWIRQECSACKWAAIRLLAPEPIWRMYSLFLRQSGGRMCRFGNSLSAAVGPWSISQEYLSGKVLNSSRTCIRVFVAGTKRSNTASAGPRQVGGGEMGRACQTRSMSVSATWPYSWTATVHFQAESC